MSEVDVKGIIAAELKAKGLDIAEDVAVKVADAIFDTIPKILRATPNKFDDLLIPVLAVVKPKVMALIDNIDGEKG